jgi:hypothetical protein
MKGNGAQSAEIESDQNIDVPERERGEEGEAKGLKLSVNISGSDVRRPAFHFGC